MKLQRGPKAFIFQLLVCFLGTALPNSGIAAPLWKKPSCPTLVTKVAVSAEPLENIDPRVKKWLQSDRKRKKDVPLEIGTAQPFKDMQLKILVHLGTGNNGAVYLVQKENSNDKNLYVAKFFKSPLALQVHIDSHNKNTLLPQVIAYDSVRSTMLMEYKEGIPVDFLDLLGEEFGFTRVEVAYIMLKYPKTAEGKFPAGNAIYSPSEKRFFLIDPF